ncbi:MAG: hypothetical protein MJ066_05770 [Clostridia bacterium]|nr:hypothetical protein [Clostridia bacterium]
MNLFYFTDAFLVFSVLSINYCRKIESSKPFLILFSIAILFAIIQVYAGKAAVKNKTSKRIPAKAEEDLKIDGQEPITQIVYAEPNEKIYNIDGVKVGEKIYKVKDGLHITVEKDGRIHNNTITETLITFLTNSGYKEIEDFGDDYAKRHWQVLKDAE